MSTPDTTISTSTESEPAANPSCEGVAEGVRQLLEDATASGRIGTTTEEEAAETLRKDLEQVERDHGLNVVPFPEPASRHSADTTSTERGAA